MGAMSSALKAAMLSAATKPLTETTRHPELAAKKRGQKRFMGLKYSVYRRMAIENSSDN